MSTIIRLSLAVLALATITSQAHAQGTARSLDLDPSVRAAGMGLASNAVFWDHGDHWGNPAHLGDERGLGYEWGETRLLPGLAADIWFRTNVVKLAGGGFGVALSGKPIGIGGLRVSYGESETVDPGGNPTGTFEPFEEIDSWSFGLSAARLGESIATFMGRDPASWSRYGDVSFGMSGKHVEIQLAPDATGHAETSAHDFGFLVRISPTEWLPPARNGILGIDLAYGWSMLSYDGEGVQFPGSDILVYPSEHERTGIAGRLKLDWPPLTEAMPGPQWFWEGFRPIVSVGLARDHSRIGPPNGGTYETDGEGWEVGFANVYWLRGGNYEDFTGDIVDDTQGWSAGLPIGRVAGFRYDYARFPQARASGLSSLKRHAASAWIDVLQVWRMMYSRGDS